jgi:hypothetical protein
MPTATSRPARVQKRVSVDTIAIPKWISTKWATMAEKTAKINNCRRPLTRPVSDPSSREPPRRDWPAVVAGLSRRSRTT